MANKFKWVNNQQFLYTSTSGIERLITLIPKKKIGELCTGENRRFELDEAGFCSVPYFEEEEA